VIVSDSYQWRTLDPALRAIIEGYQQAAPVDLSGLAKALGVPVRAATLDPGKSGEIRPDGNGGYIIKVNRHDSPGRQRFTVAHELAHFLLHRHLIGAGISDDALYRSGQSDRVEAEANRLAADIVMPSTLVRQTAITSSAASASELELELASRFNVSSAAMRIKLGNAG
jgi:hypothetical protein